ncbi:Uncharacterised protein [Serratia entomophila]|uniref:Uncharacterized protein n=1 Tax=Serratia entomophila TaxID=42906 RepID=A0ABY5CSD7_9GAMM|nr:hypothetical protein [Serratia entomophila]UIW18180.1 hypothetical protein KHA73_22735 [Serratia entomophila]USV01066.1 hypothetical protein KFQ06_00445 [Serratia entomophila]CAI0979400.1 Uncharacterised protein [Serratia entomophila]CAI0982580.1 Uncharacterised protein [Serratia entomophila]CAI0993112.1 Uncharacterised protein [Serratia entomophila]
MSKKVIVQTLILLSAAQNFSFANTVDKENGKAVPAVLYLKKGMTTDEEKKTCHHGDKDHDFGKGSECSIWAYEPNEKKF